MSSSVQPRPDFVDELEQGVKDVVKVAKNQVQAKLPPQPPQDSSAAAPMQEESKPHKKIDPVTGKPVPSKKMLTNLNQQVAQLAQMRLKKVREELEKQRLKVGEGVKGKGENAGPEIKQEQPKPKEDIVQKTLKGSKSTGEFKGLIGG